MTSVENFYVEIEAVFREFRTCEMVTFSQDGRRGTKPYLEKRHMPRPAIGLDTIHRIWAEVKYSK